MTDAELLDATRRSLAEAYAGHVLAVPADLWLFDVAVASVLDPDGLVDRAAVEAAAVALVEARPRLRTAPTPAGIRWSP